MYIKQTIKLYLPGYIVLLMLIGGGGLSMGRSLVALEIAPTLEREVVERCSCI